MKMWKRVQELPVRQCGDKSAAGSTDAEVPSDGRWGDSSK